MVLGNDMAQQLQLQMLNERNLEHSKMYICYIDYKNAFECVDCTKLMEILKTLGVDWRGRKLIWNLYSVITRDGLSRDVLLEEG